MALESIGMEENVSFSHLEAIDSLLFSESPSALTEISAAVSYTHLDVYKRQAVRAIYDAFCEEV